MPYNILDFVQVEGPDENGRYRVYADTTQLYPRTIARIREILRDPERVPQNDAEKPVIKAITSGANPITDAQWEDALTPLADIKPTQFERIEARAQTLETALGFFMRSVKLMMIVTGRPDYDTTLSRDVAFKLRYPL